MFSYRGPAPVPGCRRQEGMLAGTGLGDSLTAIDKEEQPKTLMVPGILARDETGDLLSSEKETTFINIGATGGHFHPLGVVASEPVRFWLVQCDSRPR